MRRVTSVLLLLFLALTVPLAAAGQERIAGLDQLDLTALLAPPPALDSPKQKQEVDELLGIQARRTPEQAAFAAADAERSLIRFGVVIFGPGFTADKLPKAVAFFENTRKLGDVLVTRAKDFWNKPRPFVAYAAITPCIEKPGGAAYPSGHSTFATVTAILLANMVPEKKEAIFARADQFAFNREVAGVHYPSDVAAGRVSGTVIAAFLLADRDFMVQFDAARAEVRGVLGLN